MSIFGDKRLVQIYKYTIDTTTDHITPCCACARGVTIQYCTFYPHSLFSVYCIYHMWEHGQSHSSCRNWTTRSFACSLRLALTSRLSSSRRDGSTCKSKACLEGGATSNEQLQRKCRAIIITIGIATWWFTSESVTIHWLKILLYS